MQTIHTKFEIKKILLLVLLACTILLFSGCYDLGKFGDDAVYYDSMGDVKLINQEGADKAKDYAFKDYFYNEESVKNFGGSIVNQDEYIYMILPVKSGFYLAEFALYLKSSEGGVVVYYSLYITDSIPTKTRGYSDPKSKEKSEENPEESEEIVYDDLLIENSIYSSSVTLSANRWKSFTASLITRQSKEKAKYYVSKDEYIIVKFENNSGSGKDVGYNKISFSLVDILIRAL